MRRSTTARHRRHRILSIALARAIPGMVILTLAVPTLSHARPGPEPLTIPAGTTLVVETVSEVSTKLPAGARFETRLKNDLYVNGRLVTPAGTAVYGVVLQSAGGKQFGKQELTTTLNEIQWKGGRVPLVSDTAGVVAKPGGGLLKIGGGRMVGAAVAGAPGAVVGGLVGGTMSRKNPRHITLPAGKELDVHLRMPVHLP